MTITELVDYAENPTGTPVNSDGVDIESQQPVVNKGHCWTLIKTPFQCVPTIGACMGVFLAIIGAIVIIADQLLVNKDSDQAAVTASTILGAIIIIGGMVTALTSCGDFWLIRHFKPEKDLEGQLDNYASENVKLKKENIVLKDNVIRLEDILKKYEAMAVKQEQITEQLGQLFEERTKGLRTERESLEVLVKNYESKVTQGMKEFSNETKQAKELSEQLANSNKVLREKLQALNVNVDDLMAQEEEWAKDLNLLSGENDEFKNHNFELQRLGKILNRQLEMIKQLTSSLEKNQNAIKIDVDRLDNVDDNLVVVAEKLRQTVKEKDEQLKAAAKREAKFKEGLAAMRTAILSLKKMDGWKEIFEPLMEILDQTSEVSIDDDIDI